MFFCTRPWADRRTMQHRPRAAAGQGACASRTCAHSDACRGRVSEQPDPLHSFDQHSEQCRTRPFLGSIVSFRFASAKASNKASRIPSPRPASATGQGPARCAGSPPCGTQRRARASRRRRRPLQPLRSASAPRLNPRRVISPPPTLNRRIAAGGGRPGAGRLWPAAPAGRCTKPKASAASCRGQH